MRASIAVLVVAAGLFTSAAPAHAQLSQERTLKLSFDADGLVTLRAQNVRPSEIMAEWKRLCQCAVVDAEKLTAGPIVMLGIPKIIVGASWEGYDVSRAFLESHGVALEVLELEECKELLK